MKINENIITLTVKTSLKQIKQDLLDIIQEDLEDAPIDEFIRGEEFGLREAIQIIDKYIHWTE